MPEDRVYNYISYSIKQTTVHMFLNFSKWIIQARFFKSDNFKTANKISWKVEIWTWRFSKIQYDNIFPFYWNRDNELHQ